MKKLNVPQDTSQTYGGHNKIIYAHNESGSYEKTRSSGWSVEEYATSMAVDALREQAETARQNVAEGKSSVLEYYMYKQRLDITALSQATGFFKWQIRRHLNPAVFRKLSKKKLQNYADVMGIPVSQLYADIPD